MSELRHLFSIEKEDVKNAFLQGTFDDKTHGQLAAEPVPELRKALNLREDEIVVPTKACYGLIDAPRRWWKSLARRPTQAHVRNFVSGRTHFIDGKMWRAELVSNTNP